MKKAFLIFLVLNLSSCANFFIRQECKSYNWYQLGFDAAMRGERASNDDKVMRCRKAEAEMSESDLDVGFKAGMARYCQPDTAYQTGKQGDTINYDFCDSNISGMLKQKFKEGNIAYCKDGLTAGQSGKIYKNVCTADLEKTFMPEYKKGRKKYLEGQIQASEMQLRSLNRDLDQLYYDKRNVDRRLSLLPLAVDGKEDPYKNQRWDLDNQKNSLSSRISNLNYKKSQAEQDIQKNRAESLALGE